MSGGEDKENEPPVEGMDVDSSQQQQQLPPQSTGASQMVLDMSMSSQPPTGAQAAPDAAVDRAALTLWTRRELLACWRLLL